MKLILKKARIIILILTIANTLVYAQFSGTEELVRSFSEDTVIGWKYSGLFNINISQASLTNWAAGGRSSFALNGLLNLSVQHKSEKTIWASELETGYGMLKQGNQSDWWKTDDKLALSSNFGYRLSKDFFASTMINFNTQMTDGYHYPDDSSKISGFMAPAYFDGSIGIEYRPNDNFQTYLAPAAYKLTVVLDDSLSSDGAFGVEPGKNSKHEFGGYLRIFLKKEVMENITFTSKLNMFSNYLHHPQNIDVNWECLLSMKVNKIISATLSTHLIYDDDVDIPIDKNDDGIIDEKGPRIQFKEVLAVGLSLKF